MRLWQHIDALASLDAVERLVAFYVQWHNGPRASAVAGAMSVMKSRRGAHRSPRGAAPGSNYRWLRREPVGVNAVVSPVHDHVERSAVSVCRGARQRCPTTG